jgi:hypothetical protein
MYANWVIRTHLRSILQFSSERLIAHKGRRPHACLSIDSLALIPPTGVDLVCMVMLVLLVMKAMNKFSATPFVPMLHPVQHFIEKAVRQVASQIHVAAV